MGRLSRSGKKHTGNLPRRSKGLGNDGADAKMSLNDGSYFGSVHEHCDRLAKSVMAMTGYPTAS